MTKAHTCYLLLLFLNVSSVCLSGFFHLKSFVNASFVQIEHVWEPNRSSESIFNACLVCGFNGGVETLQKSCIMFRVCSCYILARKKENDFASFCQKHTQFFVQQFGFD